MIFTGFLSLMQILFLPGLIFNAFIRKEQGALYRISYIVSFSLITNLLLVLILVSAHAYNFNIVLTIILLETAIIIFLYRKILIHPINRRNDTERPKDNFAFFQPIESSLEGIKDKKYFKVLYTIALVVALLSIGWVLYEFITQIGTVFTKWDSVINYNRWATEWSKGLFPTGACEYPQLLPANWSLTYVMTQSPIGIFAKLVQGVFPLLFVLVFFDLALSLGSVGLLFSVPLSVLILKKFAGASLFEGYMDVAVTTLILLAFYMILTDIRKNRYSRKTLWLSGIVILAAAMTKQPGVLAFGAWGLFNFIFILSKNSGKVWISIKKMFFPTLVILILIASWYLFKVNRDAMIGEPSCIAITNSWASEDIKSGFLGILAHRFSLLKLWIVFIPIMITSLFVAKRDIRLILLSYGIPYLLVSFSYGLPEAFIRYLTPISFIFALSAGILFDFLLNMLIVWVGKFPRERFIGLFINWKRAVIELFRKMPLIAFIGFLILGTAFISFVGSKYPDSKLARNNIYQQMGVGNRIVNDYLVEFYKDKDPKYSTLTWYPFINFVPGLEDRQVIYFGGNVEDFSKIIKQDDIHFILVYNTTPKEITDYAFELVKKGDLIFITDFGLMNDAVLFENKK